MSLEPAATGAALLDQAIDLLDAIDDRAYDSTTPLFPGGTVGKHVRHCLDVSDAVFSGLREGTIDYARRRRDPGTETRRETARARLVEAREALLALTADDLDRLVRVRAEVEGAPDLWFSSSVGREASYLVSHTVHHFALVAGILRAIGIEPPRELGVAPSTLDHWRAHGVPVR